MPTDLELRIATQSLEGSYSPSFITRDCRVSHTHRFLKVPALNTLVRGGAHSGRVLAWGADSAHPFAIRYFVDHLAHQAGQDYRYRRALLSQNPVYEPG